MREIKFRAWDIKNEKMYYSNGGADECLRVQLFHGDWEVDTMFENGDDAGTIPCDDKYASLMQYTGLKDNNGKDIYEGDIVTLSYGIPPIIATLEIEWTNGEYQDDVSVSGWWMKNIEKSGQSASLCDHYDGSIEIIGNKYQNPELLK